MDKVKIFKMYLSRVVESANKQNDLHKQQLIRSSNELIDMYVQAKQESEDQTKWADSYFKELQEAKKEIERLEKQFEGALFVSDYDYKPEPLRKLKLND